MSSNIATIEEQKKQLAALADLFGPTSNDDLKEGVTGGFAALSFRGKVWRVSHKGEATIIKRDEEPVSSVEVVLVKSSPNISKVFYDKTYAEGDDEAPTCLSMDGVKPDPSVAPENRQSATCAACPKNVFGSRITENGSKAKACSDNRRVAIVPYADDPERMKNEAFGGPMLLRVPPSSLNELVKYADELSRIGAPYQAVVTRISFDPELAYPKLVFRAMKALTKPQAEVVRELMDSPVLERMLTTAEAAGDQAAGAEEGAAPKEEPKEEPKAAPKEEPKEEPKADAGGLFGGDAAPAETKAPPAEEKAKESPAKQATAEAPESDPDLDSMVKDLLK